MKYLSLGIALFTAAPALAHQAPVAHLHAGGDASGLILGLCAIGVAGALALFRARRTVQTPATAQARR
jgi:hypothetical protein